MKRMFCTLWTVLLFVACTHKELCYDHAHSVDLTVQTRVHESLSVSERRE